MPLIDDGSSIRWGEHGHRYAYSTERGRTTATIRALRQAAAIHAHAHNPRSMYDIFATLLAIAQDRVGPFACTLRIGTMRNFPKQRDFAWCECVADRRCRIVVAPHFADQPPDRIEGILRHELGHAIDFVLDGSQRVRRDRSAVVRALGVEPQLGPERRADAIALIVFGSPIYYDADDVQTIAAVDHNGRSNKAVRPVRLGR